MGSRDRSYLIPGDVDDWDGKNPNRRLIKTFKSRRRGGKRGVKVEVYKCKSDDDFVYPQFKLINRSKIDGKLNYFNKKTWLFVELETLYHILKDDALEYGLRVFEGRRE